MGKVKQMTPGHGLRFSSVFYFRFVLYFFLFLFLLLDRVILVIVKNNEKSGKNNETHET